MSAILVKDLKKTYKSGKEVLHGLNLEIKKGEFVGLLGPNGAGKTTTINCITGISSISSGSVEVYGHNVVEDYRTARAKIGLSPQEWVIDMFQTVEEILYFQAGFFGVVGQERQDRLENLLNIFNLQEHRTKKFMTLSGGLKRRAAVAKALIHEPQILILDEPTAGVDVETRQEIWKYLKDLHAKGKTIVLTSHYLEEIQEMCERVVIIKNGAIIYDEKIDKERSGRELETLYLTQVANN